MQMRNQSFTSANIAKANKQIILQTNAVVKNSVSLTKLRSAAQNIIILVITNKKMKTAPEIVEKCNLDFIVVTQPLDGSIGKLT